MKNIMNDPVRGKLGKLYIPDQQIGKMSSSNKLKGLKRERREAKRNKKRPQKQKINALEEKKIGPEVCPNTDIGNQGETN